jgi:hypothetical protein
MKHGLTILERIEHYVERIPFSGCWLYTGTQSEKGYGFIKVNRRMCRVHRLLYEEMIGEIPKGMFVCHHCDVPCCVNPMHLWLGTNKENSEDRECKGRGIPPPWRKSPTLGKLGVRVSKIRILFASLPIGMSLPEISRRLNISISYAGMLRRELSKTRSS